MLRPRPLLAALVGFVVFCVLLYPSRWAELYAVMGLLRLGEWAGMMDVSRGLGGQIMGYNYYRHPQWAHWVVWIVAAGAAYAPAVIVSLLAARRVGRVSAATRCGGCWAVLRGLKEPRCPACGREL